MSFSKASLFRAVAEDRREFLASLLASGTDVNTRNDGGQTPLIIAIISGHDQLVRILLDHGADPFLTDQTGLNAVDWAERKGRMDLAGVLRRDVPKMSDNSETPPRANVSSGQPSNRATQDEEKTRRYLAGLRRRFAENPHPKTSSEIPQPKIPLLKFTNTPATGPDQPEPSTPQSQEPLNPLDETPSRVRSDPPSEERFASDAIQTEVQTTDQPIAAASRATSEVAPTISGPSTTRKRCPQCNTIYNSELLSYCAYHVVRLVDVDAPIAVAPESNRSSILLWTLVLFTLFAAAITTSYLSGRFFRNEQTPVGTVASQQADSVKGIPVAKGQLAQKVASLPVAEAPLNATKQTATVEVRIKVNRLGQIIDVASTSDNQILRDSALAAAKKATFSVDKLGGRGTTGIILYTFNP